MFRAVTLFLCAVAAHGATPLYQANFDKPNQSWSVVRGSAALDSAVLRGSAKSLRLEPGPSASDAAVRFAPVPLSIGKRYELSGWVRTENVTVRDLDRSPVAVGATLTM